MKTRRATVDVPPDNMKSTKKPLGLRLGVSLSGSTSSHLAAAIMMFSNSRSWPLSDTLSSASVMLETNGEHFGKA